MDYTVDPDELRTMARGFASVHVAIDAMTSAMASSRQAARHPVTGSAAVADALQDVGTNWSKARARMLAEVEGAARALDAAARSYTAVESDLVAALEP
jgi:uncharacterized protein YukE